MSAENEINVNDYTNDLIHLLEQLKHYRIPYGMFGPAFYPPKGVLLIDLPIEYLNYFHMRSYPKGEIGDLMEQIYELKAIGMDHLFNDIRASHGGRTILDPKRLKREQLKQEQRLLADAEE